MGEGWSSCSTEVREPCALVLGGHLVVHHPFNVSAEKLYLREAELGAGGSATVFRRRARAARGTTAEPRALKIVTKAKLPPGQQAVREAELMAKLQLGRESRGRLVRLFEVFEEAATISFVLEFCGGGDMLQWLQDVGGRFDENRARGLLRQMLDTVRYVHYNRVIHRDLKLANWLVKAKDVQAGELRLCDFGLSIEVDPNSGRARGRVGTAEYMAPEVIRGEAYDSRIDVWSLGITTYVLLSGAFPFSGVTEQKIWHQASSGDPNFDSDIWVKVSLPAQDFILALLSKDSSQRPAAQLALRFQWLLDDSLIP